MVYYYAEMLALGIGGYGMLDEEKRPQAAEEETPEPQEAAASEKEKSNSAFEWLRCLVGVVLVLVLLFTFVAQTFTVQGPSMQNTLYGGDKLLVVKAELCDIEAGDVVVACQYNAQLSDPIVKRVVAVEGQTVDIDFDTGTVYVDGQPIEEDYVAERTYTSEGTQFPVTLEEGELFLMGDNRNHSTDSRSSMLGVVDERYVVGKAVFLLFPGKTASYLGEYAGTGSRDFSRIGWIK